MNQEDKVNTIGMLEVGDGHTIYYEDWGNPAGHTIMYFHGGPGAGFKDTHKLLFNPKVHRVIFYDQRGAGRSTPSYETNNNTTQDLVNDADKLRAHLGINKLQLAGGSWGSTMALCYALAYPEQVTKILSWGIYLGRQQDNDIVNTGRAKLNFPEAWDRFINLVPKDHRQNGNSITKFYVNKINAADQKIAIKYADEWILWECTLLSSNYNQRKLEQQIVLGDDSNLAIAKLETHYFLNNCFLPENYIIANIDKIKHIPYYAVQGRFDNCTPPAIAYDLAQAYGKNMTLQWVNGGHRQSEPEMFAALTAVANAWMI